MAATKKTTTKSSSAKTAPKKKPGRKPSSRTAAAEKQKRSVAELAEQDRERRNQMTAVFLFAGGILLTALAIIPGGSGWLGIHHFLRGIFGPISYAVGPFIIYLSVILTLGRYQLSAVSKIWQMVILITLLCGISQLFYGMPQETGFFRKLLGFYVNGVQLKSGGLLAAVIGWPLMQFAGGVLGAGIIQLLLIFTFLMLISGSTLKNFFAGCAKPVQKIEKSYAEGRRRREENNPQRPSRRMTEIDIPMGDEPEESASMPQHPVVAPTERFDQALANFKTDPREIRRRKKEAEKHGFKVDPLTGEVLEDNVRPIPGRRPEALPEPPRPVFRPDHRMNSQSVWGTTPKQEPAPKPEKVPEKVPIRPEFADAPELFEMTSMRGIEEFFPEIDPEQAENSVFSLTDEPPVPEEAPPEAEKLTEPEPLPPAPKKPNPDALWSPPMSPSALRRMDADTPEMTETSPAEAKVSAGDSGENVLSGASQSDDAFGSAPSLGEAEQEDREMASSEKRLDQAIRSIENGEASPAKPAESVPAAPGTVQKLCQPAAEEPAYQIPPVSLLKMAKDEGNVDVSGELRANAEKLVDTLKSFGVQTRVVAYSHGPTVTRYELQPQAGVKISKITGLADDIALNLATAGVRIEAPIPNKPAVGIEVPNKKRSMVCIREIIDSDEFRNAKGTLPIALGKDIAGNIAVGDIASMPHMLIAGTTGSGKSVCVNSILISILYKFSPKDVRLILIDPKVVELAIYNGIPHLLIPVVTDPKKAAGALAWAVTEMQKRYAAFAENSVRDIKGYNRLAEKNPDLPHMPQVVIVIDELSDLMMATPGEVEDSICRLAQMARAAGMHLIVATQRPSVDVVTGLIKANIPSRVALAVSSQVDSRTILDTGGAEKLLGHGDMLYAPLGFPKPVRVQGCFVSDSEIEDVVNFIKDSIKPVEYDHGILDEIDRQAAAAGNGRKKGGEHGDDNVDELYEDAVQCILDAGQCSTSFLQRRLKVGYARAARLVDELEERGIVGPPDGSKPREILITKAQWAEFQLRNHMDD